VCSFSLLKVLLFVAGVRHGELFHGLNDCELATRLQSRQQTKKTAHWMNIRPESKYRLVIKQNR
jgi:hypothetical protein